MASVPIVLITNSMMLVNQQNNPVCLSEKQISMKKALQFNYCSITKKSHYRHSGKNKKITGLKSLKA
jgi:hypothetical protein